MDINVALLGCPVSFSWWKASGFSVGAFLSFNPESDWSSDLHGIKIELIPLFPDIQSRVKRRRLESSDKSAPILRGIGSKWRAVGAERDSDRLRVYVYHKEDFATFSRLPPAIIDSVHWKSLTHLFLPNSEIEDLSPFIGKLENLQAIDLAGSKISRFPEWMGQMATLKHLKLSETSITSLPSSIEGLKSLESLVLSETKLTSLPESIGKLTSLQKLGLYGTDIEMLPSAIGNLKNLSELSLSLTKIKNFPDTFGKLSCLTELSLSDTYSLESIPSSFGGLRNLVLLNLERSSVKTLPDEISGLVNLEKLLFEETKIRSLPPSIGRWKNLKVLDLSCAKNLRQLPEDIGDLSSLKKMDICCSAITSLPDSIKRLPGPWIICISHAGVFGGKKDPKTICGFLMDLARDCPSLIDIEDIEQRVYDGVSEEEEDLYLGIPWHWQVFVRDFAARFTNSEECVEDFNFGFQLVYLRLGINRARFRQSIGTPTLWPLALQNALNSFECKLDDFYRVTAPTAFDHDAVHQLIRSNLKSFVEMCIHRNARSCILKKQN